MPTVVHLSPRLFVRLIAKKLLPLLLFAQFSCPAAASIAVGNAH